MYGLQAACFLSNRLQSVIKSIVDPSQVAYIKGRYIGTNIRIVEDIFEYINSNCLEDLFLMLNLRMAFDSYGWNFLF